MFGIRVVALVLAMALASSFCEATTRGAVLSMSELLYSDTRGLDVPLKVRADVVWSGHGFILLEKGCQRPCEHLARMDVSEAAKRNPRVATFVSSVYSAPNDRGVRLRGVLLLVRPTYYATPRPSPSGRLRYVAFVALDDVEVSPPR